MNRRQQILILCIVFGLGIVAILAGVMTLLNAGATPMPSERLQGSPPELPELTEPSGSTANSSSGYSLSLSTVDASTGKSLGDVSVYLDGRYEGSTSVPGITGVLNISALSEGTHTIRVSKSGYTDYTQTVVIPSPSPLKIGLQGQLLSVVQEPGPHDAKINIVFIPSSTTYNCAQQKKITTTKYLTDRSAFVSDVHAMVNESLFTLDSVTDKTHPIPADYRDRFNIYYYYDPSQFADAFNGCAGTVPEKFWKTVPFADIVIILYPTYYTPDTGAPCEPNGCVNPGTGRSWMKIPADQKVLFLHESGHAIFGLIDTYCGSTEYWQNDPDPNVWSSYAACVQDAKTHSRDPSGCRQIQQASPAACSKQFWRRDPDPDIMHAGYYGVFGEASTRRITYIFDNINAWGKTA